MTNALQRILPDQTNADTRAATIKGALVLGVLPCIAIALLLSVSAHLITPLFNVADKDSHQLEMAITLFVWAIPLWATVEITTSALRACKAFGPEIRLRLLWEQVIRLVLVVLFWMAGFDTLALVLAHLASLVLTGILALRALNRYISLKLVWNAGLSTSMLRELLISGLSILPLNILGRTFSDMPIIILNILLPGAAGANAAGLYSLARKVSSIPQLVGTVFSHVLAPVAASSENREVATIQSLYSFSIRLSILLSLPTTIILIIYADSLLSLFVTGAAAAWPIVVILTIARGFESTVGPATAIQQAISHRGLPVLNGIIGLISATVVTLIAFPLYSTIGVALGVATGQVIMAALAVWQLSSMENLHAYDSTSLRICSAALTACLAIFVAGRLTSVAPSYIQGSVVLLVYLMTIWFSLRFALPIHDRLVLGKLGHRFRLIS